MKITDLLNPKGFDLDAHVSTKAEAIDHLVDLMYATGNIADKAKYRACVQAREEEGTTGIGEGVAIPHAKTSAVLRPGLAVMIVRDGCDYDAENAKKEKDAAEQAETPKSGYRLLAVTACPTGIAHTYMAAEGLADKAKEMGISIKVETDGSGGVKNALTPEEIAACEAVIVAADREVEMARFDGKPLVQTQVSDGINKPQELIERALSGDAPIYHAAAGSSSGASTSSGNHEGVGRTIYKDLMNGVSHMLPFVIGGGILMALSFLLDTILAPNGPAANFGTNSSVAAFFNSAGNGRPPRFDGRFCRRLDGQSWPLLPERAVCRCEYRRCFGG